MPFPRWGDWSLLIFHAPKGVPYAKENSLAGIDWAVQSGANAIDHDYQLTEDGYFVNTHWRDVLKRGGFHDLSGVHQTGSGIRVNQMTLAEVKRLQHKDGYHINSLADDAAYAARKGVTLCIEQKGDPRLEDPEVWARAYAEVEKAGARACVMSLPDMGHPVKVLRAAGGAGFRTMLLTRGAVPRVFYTDADISAVKGPAARSIGLPQDVVRLGTSSVNATRYGCSVGTSSTAARRVVAVKGGKPTFYR